MRIEGSDNRSATLDFRGGLGAPDNFMMACVHAIEKPNREMHWTRLCREISDGMEDFQREGKKRLAFFSGLSTLFDGNGVTLPTLPGLVVEALRWEGDE